MDLVDREGLAALTMRRLATDLGVEPMALYRYAASKQALLDGVIEMFFAEVNADLAAQTVAEHARPQAEAAVAWRQELQRIAHAYARVAQAHPSVFPLVATRPVTLPLARRPAPMLQLNEHVLALLARSGFDEHTRLRIYRALTAWVVGYLLVDKRQMIDNPEEPDPLLRLGLHRLPAAQYPHLRATAPLLADHDAERELASGLGILLDQAAEGPAGAARAAGRTP
ncbi:TetR/AcrR family transcriptional regulator [Streptomyces sp. NPDC015220]|uniref:TetR/AcrR family transcriptional regulator n=1 Tax=Streptomyces sp. NPDC015220 TaxID=3364947 RepID=UPI0036F6ECC8